MFSKLQKNLNRQASKSKSENLSESTPVHTNVIYVLNILVKFLKDVHEDDDLRNDSHPREQLSEKAINNSSFMVIKPKSYKYSMRKKS